MTSEALAAAFNPAEVERGLYDRWDEAGYFAPNDRFDRKPFVVIMPPPNVTASSPSPAAWHVDSFRSGHPIRL